MASSLQQIVSDPEFAKLSDEDKRTVIARVDPTFTQLQPQEQQQVMARLAPPDVRSQIAARKANPPAAAMGDPRAVPQSTLETYAPQIAHPLDTLGGAVKTVAGGVMGLAHPIDTVKNDMAARGAAFERLKARGIDVTDPEFLRDAFEYAVPLMGPAFASAGRQMNSTDPHQRAEGTGSAMMLTAGPEITRGVLGDAAGLLPNRETAIAQYTKVLDPLGKNPVVAKDIATRLVDEKRTLSDPKTELTAIQEQRAAAADQNINSAIANMKQPVNADAVDASVQSGRQAQYSPYGPDTEATVRAIDKNAKTIQMNARGDVATKTNVIDPSTARDLRIQFDKRPYAKESTSITANADKVAGDALRNELNKDADVADANKAFQKEKAGKDLAQQIPETKPIDAGKRLALLGIDAVAAATVPGYGWIKGAIGAGTLASLARDVMTSPGYKTWSAVKKAQFAEAVNAGDVARVGEIAGATAPASGEMDKKALAREIMRQKQPQRGITGGILTRLTSPDPAAIADRQAWLNSMPKPSTPAEMDAEMNRMLPH